MEMLFTYIGVFCLLLGALAGGAFGAAWRANGPEAPVLGLATLVTGVPGAGSRAPGAACRSGIARAEVSRLPIAPGGQRQGVSGAVGVITPRVNALPGIYAVWRSVNTTPMVQLAVGVAILLALIWAMHWSTSLLVPPSCSWWRRNRRANAAFGLLVAFGAVLILALVNDCLYSCQQWESTGIDVLTTIAGFWVGMILAGSLSHHTMPLRDWIKTKIGLIVLLLIGTVVIFSSPSGPLPNSAVIFIWALGLPILGVAAKRIWPRLF